MGDMLVFGGSGDSTEDMSILNSLKAVSFSDAYAQGKGKYCKKTKLA